MSEQQLSATFSTTWTAVHVVHESHCPDIGPICAVRDEPAQIHDQMFYVGEFRPIVEYGISEHFGFELQLPIRVTRTTIVYRRLDGSPYAPDFANIHHRNETLFGLSDPWISGRAYWQLGALRLAGRLGFTLPVGRTEENPFALGREGKLHQHLQLGTGTFNPVGAFDATYAIGRFNLRAYAQAQLMLYENTKGFRAGHRFGIGILADVAIVGGLRVSAGGDIINEQPERWNGRVEQDGNLGRTDYLVGGSVSYPLATLLLSLGVKVPVYQQIIRSESHEGGQLTYPAIISLSVQTTLDLGTSE